VELRCPVTVCRPLLGHLHADGRLPAVAYAMIADPVVLVSGRVRSPVSVGDGPRPAEPTAGLGRHRTRKGEEIEGI